ncbi:hypothetical protein VP01_5174g1 [Puccinia sorghi]|uniref:GAG-pre-integrase domain-containing protein n=1 Tax=Puccinia sorghi TaxID=27349 RepID=A0A0L6UKU6_9BASI|nr:hypothetical protein VP01_5174g1 [Puccinia sorghi]
MSVRCCAPKSLQLGDGSSHHISGPFSRSIGQHLNICSSVDVEVICCQTWKLWYLFSCFFVNLESKECDVIKTGKQDATLPIRGLSNCLFVPDIVIKLISPGFLEEKGCSVLDKDGRFQVRKNLEAVIRGSISNGLYSVDKPSAVGNGKPNSYAHVTSLKEVHKSFGHASIGRFDHFIPKSFSQAEKSAFECKSCALSKITKQPLW